MKLLATLAVLAAATIGSASASIITYNTAGSMFTTIGGSPASGITLTATNGPSSTTITYGNILNGSTFDDAIPGTFFSLGLLTNGFTGPDASITIPSFTLTILFNTNNGNRTVLATSGGGTISQNSSNVAVSFAPSTFTIATTNYTSPGTVGINPSTSFNGQLTAQAFGVANTTPEPGTMLLLGAGLIGIGFSARKKFLSRS